jgi:hypothetical protein
LLRVKQIEDNKGKTIVSEGIDAITKTWSIMLFCHDINEFQKLTYIQRYYEKYYYSTQEYLSVYYFIISGLIKLNDPIFFI